MNEFDELNDNINNLISELRNKSDNQALSPMNDFDETTKSYEDYLKNIQSNTQNINDTLNSYLKDINTLETADINADVEKVPVIDNNVEQQSFVDYNEELKRLIERISDLSMQLSDVKGKVDLDIDLSILENISDKIKDATLNINDDLASMLDYKVEININSEDLYSELDILTEKLKELEEPIQLYFSSHIEQIQETITSLKEEQEKGVSVSNLTEIETLVSNLNKLNNLELSDKFNVVLNDTLDKIETLKNSDLQLNINASTNIDAISTKLQEIKDIKLDVLFDMDNMHVNIDGVKTTLNGLKDDIGVFNINANLDIKSNIDEVKADFKNMVSDIEIKPKNSDNILPEQLTTNITQVENIEHKAPETMEIQQQDVQADKKMGEYFAANTEAINQLKDVVTMMIKTQVSSPTNVTYIDKPKSDTKAESKNSNEPSMSDVLNVLTQSISVMVQKQSQMVSELKKSNFLNTKD
jgi:hypothetical protein